MNRSVTEQLINRETLSCVPYCKGREHQVSQDTHDALTLVYSENYFELEGSSLCQQPQGYSCLGRMQNPQDTTT